MNISTDDVYTNSILLPFDFPFYGTAYSSLVVSANGYISFDLSNADGFSHYGILNNGSGLTATGSLPGQDLPSLKYDRALIMAPYQDLNAFYTTSPGKLMEYDEIGTAPHRKWILSYYKIPLYSIPCQNLIYNTSQLVLYESTGIVEVFINSKQICTGWNKGKAMIGMQDETKAIMAPGRAASDTSWGSIDMNESWRFTPAEGVPLLKKVELYSLAGNLVTIGDTLDIGNGNYQVNFNNVCADSSATYVMKSTYKKIDDPSVEVYATDTIHVIKPLGVNASQTVWTGSVSTAWEEPLNWSCGNLPTSSSNVIINHDTVIINSNVTVNSITVQPGAGVTVNPGYNFTIIQPH